ncbi:STAS domain-containing protein [Naasia sp. SYSU D00948]|uniref:STAS domain-containing protein n=1 Tax=Naasia sp. SYSU D00948 TaxID=2817379 RepID=UPI001B300C37|nr:STAS domain-containing protein [Naasia sp. SYSU D00948]
MEFTEQKLPGGTHEIAPRGRLNLVAAPALRSLIAERVQAGNRRIVLDLQGVDFLDSSGLGAIIASLKTAREAGGDLRLARASDAVVMVLRLTKVDRVLRVYADSGSAFADA